MPSETSSRRVADHTPLEFGSRAVAPHNPNVPIASAATVHVAFATPNWLIQEVLTQDVPWRSEIVDEPIRIDDGYIAPPAKLGLGIEVDEEAAAKFPLSEEAEQRYFHPDGSVANW